MTFPSEEQKITPAEAEVMLGYANCPRCGCQVKVYYTPSEDPPPDQSKRSIVPDIDDRL